MEIIEAVWEKKLGVNVLEIELTRDDYLALPEKTKLIHEAVKSYDAKYIVVKAKTPMHLKTTTELQKEGFVFAENQIGLKYIFKDNKANIQRLQKLAGSARQICVKQKKQLDFICQSIKEGMFTTDRIALDPYFGLKVANQRYANWVRQEYEKGSDVYLINLENESIGFSIMKTAGNGIRYSLLGGLFPEYQKSGYAIYNIGASLLDEYRRGTRQVCTSVSSNNPEILRLDEYLCLKITEITNVFVKHIN